MIAICLACHSVIPLTFPLTTSPGPLARSRIYEWTAPCHTCKAIYRITQVELRPPELAGEALVKVSNIAPDVRARLVREAKDAKEALLEAKDGVSPTGK